MQVRYLATSSMSRPPSTLLLAVVKNEATLDRKRGDRPKTAHGTPIAASVASQSQRVHPGRGFRA